MKKHSLLLFAVITTVFLNSCSKEDTKVNEPTTTAFTVYKNPIGDANADALQAQNTDSKGTLNFYGAFDSENNPSEIRTLTYQKANNDTIVNLIMDPLTNRLASSYYSVKGVKSPVVLKFDYIEGVSNAYNLSYYNYNWENKTSELLYAARVETNNGVASSNPFFANRGPVVDGFKLLAQSYTIGFVTVKIIVPIVSGLITASATVIAAAVAAPIVTTAAVGAVLLFLIPKAGAAELDYTPSSSTPPSKTPIINPVPATGNPTSNLETSSCVNTNMTFRASMDFEGSILISEVAGGQAPYTYMVTSGFQQSQVFPKKYKDGSYVVGIKDANGCVGVKLVSLKRGIDCSSSTLSVTISNPVIKKETWAAVIAQATGGDSNYEFKWSDGQYGRFADFFKSGIYTVTVTDAAGNGCSKSESITLNLEQVPNLLSGTTWKQISNIHCGIDLWTIPEGEKVFSTVCNTYLGENTGSCSKDDITIFIDNYEGYFDKGVKCDYSQADKEYFKYTFDGIDNIVEEWTGVKYRIELNGSTMTWVYGDPVWGYKRIFEKQ